MAAVTANPGQPHMAVTAAELIAHTGQPISPQARAAMEPLSRILSREMARYIDNQMENIYAQRPEFSTNELFVETVREICRYNITAFARIVAGSTPAEEAAAIRPAAFNSGAMMSKAGISLPELLEVYRRGQALLLQDFLGQAFGELEAASPFNEILHHCMIWWSAYVDGTLAHTVDGFVEDYERLRTHFQARRLRAVEAVLQGRLTDVAQASAELCYELRAAHVGFVITHPSGGTRGDFESAVERFVEHAGQALGARHTLVVPFNSGQKWAWVGGSDLSEAPSLGQCATDLDLRVAMGGPARGLPGFITTNRQAHYASLTVEDLPDTPSFAAYPDVAVLSLIKPDRNRIRAFVQDQLGGLASRDPRMAELRQTVAVFLHEGRHAPRTAEALHTHKNTVHYRIARAEEVRRRPIQEKALELELALRLVADYGDWTLAD